MSNTWTELLITAGIENPSKHFEKLSACEDSDGIWALFGNSKPWHEYGTCKACFEFMLEITAKCESREWKLYQVPAPGPRTYSVNRSVFAVWMRWHNHTKDHTEKNKCHTEPSLIKDFDRRNQCKVQIVSNTKSFLISKEAQAGQSE